MTLASNDTTEGTVSPAQLVFTALNWSTVQTATVTGVDDAVDDGDIAYTIVTAITSGDPLYAAIDPADVGVTNLDDDVAGVTVAPTSGLTTTEAGATATFTLVLASQPTTAVTVTLASNDTTEGTVSPAQLVFTALNWSTVQTATVTGVDDAVDDGAIAYAIVTAITSGDPHYAAIDPADVGVDESGQRRSGRHGDANHGQRDRGGSGSSYSVGLTTQPTGNVTITLSVGVHASVSPAQLVFTPGNWNTAQSVAVSAVDDAVAEGAHVETITHGGGQQRRQLQRHQSWRR